MLKNIVNIFSNKYPIVRFKGIEQNKLHEFYKKQLD